VFATDEILSSRPHFLRNLKLRTRMARADKICKLRRPLGRRPSSARGQVYMLYGSD
jgi:hypothetical protein